MRQEKCKRRGESVQERHYTHLWPGIELGLAIRAKGVAFTGRQFDCYERLLRLDAGCLHRRGASAKSRTLRLRAVHDKHHCGNMHGNVCSLDNRCDS